MNNKSKIIPEEMKQNIDEILEQQLFNANRYYAESNSDISQLMNIEVKRDSIDFLRRLKERWLWHNHFYEDLFEPAYSDIIKDKSVELSPVEIDSIIEIFKTVFMVDEATLVMSGAIKKHLDYHLSKINLWDENLSTSSALNALITPPIETFYAEYQVEHLTYIYLLKIDSKDKNTYKDYLIKKYHANDNAIFKSRFEKKFSYFFNFDAEQILKQIEGYKINENYKISHYYFTLEHPDRKAIRDILIMDNMYEKLLSRQLIGISGFLFRKKILEYLNETNILPNEGYIYEYSNDIILSCLEKLKQLRCDSMEKNVRPYRQRGMTCAISCLMMAMEYFGVLEKANWLDEKRLYGIYQSRYMDGTPFSAVAFHLAKKGLPTEIFHSEKEIFTNKKHLLTKMEFEGAMDEYKSFLDRAEKLGVKTTNGININSLLLKQQLEKGNLVIIAGQHGIIFHAILLCGYEDDKFIVCDPLYKNKEKRTFEQIDSFMNTDIGKWFISIGPQREKKDSLLTELNGYQDRKSTRLNSSH